MRRAPPLELAVVVVSFNTRELLEQCLLSIEAARPARIVVVDNRSPDGSAELVRDRFPAVELIVPDRNLGYGAAANLGIAACEQPAVLLLNGDTIIAPDAPAVLGRALAEHPQAGIVAPRLANPDGSLQPSTHPWPSPADMLLADTGLHKLVRRVPWLRERFLRTWGHDRERTVPWARGAALAIRRSAFDAVGGFDERYFMYWEEVDLARRLRGAGMEVLFCPAATIVHIRAASTSQSDALMRREWLIGHRRYLLAHETRRRAAVVLGLQRALTWARLLRDALRALWKP